MIELYKADRDFGDNKNGDYVLTPDSCTITAELNGTWQLSLSHPLDPEGIWAEIDDGAVIKAPSWQGVQLWRIFSRTRSEGGVTATAYPIFLDAANDVFLQDVRPTNTDGAGALQAIFSGTVYSCESDITRTATAYYIRKNAIEAIAGTEENSFLKRWGGEIIYDNYTIKINERAGSDKGFRIAAGLNQLVDGIRETIDWSDVVTRVVPVAYNGYTLDGSTPWVDSPSISLYPVIRTKVWQFDNIRLASEISEGEDTTGMYLASSLSDLRSALRTYAAALFSDDYIDQPKITVDVDMVELGSLSEYKYYTFKDTVELGDTVQVENTRIGVWYELRVAALEYDCIRQRVTRVTVGEVPKDAITEFAKQSAEAQAAAAADGGTDEETRIVSTAANGTEAILANGMFEIIRKTANMTQRLIARVYQLTLSYYQASTGKTQQVQAAATVGFTAANGDTSTTVLASDKLTIRDGAINETATKPQLVATKNSIAMTDANGDYTGTFNGKDLDLMPYAYADGTYSVSDLIGYGYTIANGNCYLFFDHWDQIPAGKTITINSGTLTLYAEGGRILYNANLMTYLQNAIRNSQTHKMRIYLSGVYGSATPVAGPATAVLTANFTIS